MELENELKNFTEQHKIKTKGPLSVMLVITRAATIGGLPLDADSLLTGRGGQVKGLGHSMVQAILKDHGIERTLAKEGGRTSRGSIEHMRVYVDLLNKLHAAGVADLKQIEKWWVGHVYRYFASMPFKIKLDASKSLRAVVKDLISQALQRQKETSGTAYVGAMMQHIVGAKLEIIASGYIKHHGFSVADAPADRKGDFLVEDTAIHVTSSPTEALISKCNDNLSSELHPIIITLPEKITAAEVMANNIGIEDRIDIFEVEQFVATNLHEKSGFSKSKRRVTVEKIVGKYNEIIDSCETDPSLKIQIA